MARKIVVVILVLFVFFIGVWGISRAAHRGYLSSSDASPSDLKMNASALNNTLIVEWSLKGGERARSLSDGRDAIIIILPWGIEGNDNNIFSLADFDNLSVQLGKEEPRTISVGFHKYEITVSNGTVNETLTVVDIPVDFPSSTESGRVVLKFRSYHSCNNLTLGIMYFHYTGSGEYRDVEVPLSVGIDSGFPIAPGFKANFKFVIPKANLTDLIESAVNFRNSGDWLENPRGWLVVKTVNITVCPPETS
jgi:hypothetical protein